MGKTLPVFSPTGLRTLKECPRKWAFRYVDKIELDPEEAPWKEQGTRMHAHLERAKLTGETPPQDDPEARVASAAIQYWPRAVQWEPEKTIEVHRGFWILRGVSDQLGPGFVGDYKFTGDKKNLPERRPYWEKLLWPRVVKGVSVDALRETAINALRDDPQPIGYGAAALQGGRCSVVCLWTYVIKPPKMEGEPKVIPVPFRLSADEIDRGLRDLDRWADLGIYIKSNFARASEVPANPWACGGVGISCDYSDHCKTTKGPTVAKEQTIDDILAELTGGELGANPPEARSRKIRDEEDEDEDAPAPKRRKRPEPEEDDDEDAPAPKRRKRPEPEPEEDEDEDDEDEDEEPAPKKRGPGRPRKKRPEPAPKKRGPGRPRKAQEDDDEDEEDEEPAPKRRKRPEPEPEDDEDEDRETFKIFGTMDLGGKRFFVVGAPEGCSKKIGDEIG